MFGREAFEKELEEGDIDVVDGNDELEREELEFNTPVTGNKGADDFTVATDPFVRDDLRSGRLGIWFSFPRDGVAEVNLR